MCRARVENGDSRGVGGARFFFERARLCRLHTLVFFFCLFLVGALAAPHPNRMTPVAVLDNGAATIRVGMATDAEPR